METLPNPTAAAQNPEGGVLRSTPLPEENPHAPRPKTAVQNTGKPVLAPKKAPELAAAKLPVRVHLNERLSRCLPIDRSWRAKRCNHLECKWCSVPYAKRCNRPRRLSHRHCNRRRALEWWGIRLQGYLCNARLEVD